MAKGSWDNWKRSKQKGLDARAAGNWDAAVTYLRQAAQELFLLSKEATWSEELRQQRLQGAARLLELAKDCERAKSEGRRSPAGSARRSSSSDPTEKSSEGEDGASADQWVVKEKPSLRFADVAGLEDVKEEIRMKMIYPFEHPELAARYGIKAGGGVLMYGPPGTGKTMLAKATAGEIEATFFKISPADVLSKWVGEAEQNIKKLFDAAAAEAKSIIFIDEIEALVPARREDGGSSVMQRVVPQILQGVEGFDKKAGRPVLLMGATNVPWQLDPAMLRPGRFDEKIYIPLPDLPALRKMLDLYLANRPLAAGVDLDALAQRLEGYSGADVKEICDTAAEIPFRMSIATGQEGDITTEILEAAVADTPRSVTPEVLKRFDEWSRAAARG